VVALGVLCSGIAYILYFRLIEEVGTTSALTVTFLNPVFGILWGALFLGETIGWYTIAGSAITLVGTALVTGFVPRFGRRGRERRRAQQMSRRRSHRAAAGYAGATPSPSTAAMPKGWPSASRARRIRKGVMVDGVPVLLEIDLGAQPDQALCTVDAGAHDADRGARCNQDILLNMLGLRIDPEPFEAPVADDPLFAPLVRASAACA
jgi:hypothetical protein